jgi:HAD superfamily hydrolase (TIGR01509 family)
MFKAILFDIDGTLVDSNDLHVEAWVKTFRHFGADISTKAVHEQIGKGGDNLIPALLPPEMVDRQRDEIEAFRVELFKRDYLALTRPFPGVCALFERLHADGKQIVLASSAKGEEVEHHLGSIGCRDLVGSATSADEVEHSKPDPDIFLAALRKVAPLGADDVVVIGDTPYDIEAAAKAGIRAIAFRSGGFPEAVLRDAGCIAIYDGPEDLLRNYDRSPLAS